MKKLFPLLGLLILITLIISCASKPIESTGSAQAYADPMLENILVALDNNKYEDFSADFDTSLKNILIEAVFDQLVSQIQSSLGAYQTKVFVSESVQGSNASVLYIADYSDEPAGVMVTAVFQTVNGITYVHSLNLDSPNLRGQPIDVSALRKYSDVMTEKILVAINGNDYSGFVNDMNSTMKAAESQSAFDQLYELIKSRIGDYTSKKFENAFSQQEYIVVRYLAEYSDEPEGVWITISFDKNQQVAGLYFDSPKIRAK